MEWGGSCGGGVRWITWHRMGQGGVGWVMQGWVKVGLVGKWVM